MKLPMFFCLCLLGQAINAQNLVHESPSLKIISVSDKVLIHLTYLNSPSFGLVGCNGMIYMNDDEAIVFDTPPEDSTSNELIDWIEAQGRKITAVVVNHFHEDAIGGLKAFHLRNIPSYGSTRTQELVSDLKPQIGFEKIHKLQIGKESVENRFFGEAHSRDNIVSYLPSEKVLFGGCMIKALKSGKGNLADANLDQWSLTVEAIKNAYSDVAVVIPGHGDPGDIELLNYTIQMFKER